MPVTHFTVTARPIGRSAVRLTVSHRGRREVGACQRVDLGIRPGIRSSTWDSSAGTASATRPRPGTDASSSCGQLRSGVRPGTPQRLPVSPDRFGLVLGVDVPRQLDQVQFGKRCCAHDARTDRRPAHRPRWRPRARTKPRRRPARGRPPACRCPRSSTPPRWPGRAGWGVPRSASSTRPVRGPARAPGSERPGAEAVEGKPLLLGVGLQKAGGGLLIPSWSTDGLMNSSTPSR